VISITKHERSLPSPSGRSACRVNASNDREPKGLKRRYGVLLLGLLGAIGCRGRAYDDVYRAKLTQEIRVLEDQLYDADYQNRVLREELERARRELAQEAPPPPERRPAPSSAPEIDIEVNPETSETYEVLDPESLSDPSAAEANSDKPPAAAPPVDEPATDKPGTDEPAVQPKSETPAPLQDPKPSGAVPAPIPDPSNSEPGMLLPPPVDNQPPAEPVPPAEEQLRDDPIIPGEVLPPDEAPDAPPGKIEISPDTKTMKFEPLPPPPTPVPDRLELHDGLSGGHQFDDDHELDGLLLVVTAVDQRGQAMALDDFDIDAELTVVVMEPGKTAPEEAVGRWEFSPGEVRGLVRKAPVDGLHIPIPWRQRVPEGEEVIVHIRLAAAEEEMRCQGRVRLETSVAMSNWLPRG